MKHLQPKNKFLIMLSDELFPIHKNKQSLSKVAIIGAGWFGVHIALELSKVGYKVTIYEKNETLFNGTSGNFGIRIHAGQHYPRSYTTRSFCRHGFYEMKFTYPELCNEQQYAIYGLGKRDADDKPSKVSMEVFDKVAYEFRCKGKVDLLNSPLNPSELLAAYNIDECTAILGERLRSFFKKKLSSAGVSVQYNFLIKRVAKTERGILVGNDNSSRVFKHVVDSTGFQQNFLAIKRPLPFNMDVVYQTCIALIYKDTKPGKKPISFIVMDGWFPCLMPYDDRLSTEFPMNKYIVTHGKWTILGSYHTSEKAHQLLSSLKDEFVKTRIRIPCEKEMTRFWPKFLERFEYMGWTGSVLAKLKTEQEFRSSVALQEPIAGMIRIFPGKITHIFDMARETLSLIVGKSIKVSKSGYRYVRGGLLDMAKVEIQQPVITESRNTCNLMTYEEILNHQSKNKCEKKTKHLSHLLKRVYLTKSTLTKSFIFLFTCLFIKKIYSKNKSVIESPKSSVIFISSAVLFYKGLKAIKGYSLQSSFNSENRVDSEHTFLEEALQYVTPR